MRRATTILVILAIAAAAGASSALSAQQPDAASTAQPRLEERYGARLATFEEMVAKQMAADHTTGLAIALMVGDSVWARAFGFADVENRTPMKPESSFRLASVTKPMTAIGVLQLVEQGKIVLDAEIQTYVPYFPRKKHPVTVRQLLGHLGGIPHYKNPERELHIKDHKNTREAIAIFEDYDLVAEPGTRYSYSTYGYNLLGAAIEGASGQAYGDYMREHVWGPLGMNDTRLDDPRDVIPNRVRGYEWTDGRLRNSEFVDISSRFAGGGTRATVLDLVKFGRGFMDGKLLSAASMAQMTQRMTLRDGHYTDYGLGWGVDPLNGHYVISHSGGQNETRTLLFVFPARRVVIAAATNFESGDLFWYVQALVAQVFGERWDRSGGSAAYVPGRVERAQLAVLRDAFLHGLFSFEKAGGPRTEDPAKLGEAFAFFNGCVAPKALSADLGNKRKKCRDGLHPLAGEPLTVVGSFVAQTLAKRRGAPGLDGYHATGAVPFFADYVAAYRSTAGFPRELRLDADLERQLAKWNRDWLRTFPESMRTPARTASWGLDARRLREAFAGASIYPDFSFDIAGVARRFCGEGNRERALEAAGLNYGLYPEAPSAVASLAGAHLCFGEAGPARTLLKKARRLDEEGSATNAGSLNAMAYELAGVGRLDGATQLLRIATEMYPKEANLYDSLGELELKAGRREASIAAYRKALEIDPKLESSIRALAAIERTKKLKGT